MRWGCSWERRRWAKQPARSKAIRSTNFVIDLAPADVTAFFAAADPRALAVTHLGTATTRIIYDLDTVPVCAASIARETHVSDLASGNQTKVQLRFVYSDGFGREAQTKVQAEPGPLDLADPNSPVANPRWVDTGEKVYNNKGKPVRQYEPFFSATTQFSIEKWGVSSTLFYDPVERVAATLHPNNTFEKVVFDPWQQMSFDVNDTVTFDPKTDPDVGAFFSRLPDAVMSFMMWAGSSPWCAISRIAQISSWTKHCDIGCICLYGTLMAKASMKSRHVVAVALTS